ncbi:hypothetical protein ON010_g14926 [Phytophthora cinnamomi]|nr:hypothetical protein ON010_g14926 [Phytophthora cinnamomi]
MFRSGFSDGQHLCGEALERPFATGAKRRSAMVGPQAGTGEVRVPVARAQSPSGSSTARTKGSFSLVPSRFGEVVAAALGRFKHLLAGAPEQSRHTTILAVVELVLARGEVGGQSGVVAPCLLRERVDRRVDLDGVHLTNENRRGVALRVGLPRCEESQCNSSSEGHELARVVVLVVGDVGVHRVQEAHVDPQERVLRDPEVVEAEVRVLHAHQPLGVERASLRLSHAASNQSWQDVLFEQRVQVFADDRELLELVRRALTRQRQQVHHGRVYRVAQGELEQVVLGDLRLVRAHVDTRDFTQPVGVQSSTKVLDRDGLGRQGLRERHQRVSSAVVRDAVHHCIVEVHLGVQVGPERGGVSFLNPVQLEHELLDVVAVVGEVVRVDDGELVVYRPKDTWDSLEGVLQELRQVLDHLGVRLQPRFRDAEAHVLELRQLGRQLQEGRAALRHAQRPHRCSSQRTQPQQHSQSHNFINCNVHGALRDQPRPGGAHGRVHGLVPAARAALPDQDEAASVRGGRARVPGQAHAVLRAARVSQVLRGRAAAAGAARVVPDRRRGAQRLREGDPLRRQAQLGGEPEARLQGDLKDARRVESGWTFWTNFVTLLCATDACSVGRTEAVSEENQGLEGTRHGRMQASKGPGAVAARRDGTTS